MIREPIAMGFYPFRKNECENMIIQMLKDVQKVNKEFDEEFKKDKKEIVAGIVPHAGWVYSGKISLGVFNAIKERQEVDTFILLGAVHGYNLESTIIAEECVWKTPLGDVFVDVELARKILNECSFLVNDPISHLDEHSIEVQVPFIKFLFPKSQIVPIMIQPDNNAIIIGKKIAEVVKRIKIERKERNRIVIIGTSDLTHYGLNYGFAPKGYGINALKWVKEENDKSIIELMINLRADEIIDDSIKRRNACGAGAITATVSAAKNLECKKGFLLKYTTSYDVHPEDMSSFVGYCGVVF